MLAAISMEFQLGTPSTSCVRAKKREFVSPTRQKSFKFWSFFEIAAKSFQEGV